jgi:nitrate/TMAO reductase-like tetraheme cytochrome c subunit/mono/diheme cytochrome c family protein
MMNNGTPIEKEDTDNLLDKVRRFFFPPTGSSTLVRILPYIALGTITLTVFIVGGAVWEYTNSSEFCGTACHTMPPEYTSYLTSPHARVECVECHIGRGFLATQFTRKAGDIKHITSLAFKTYEFPIRADDMRPARDSCEKCHFPEKFSDDSLRELKQYRDDLENTPISIYLTLKTGGGSERQGLGRGIHWHIENKVTFLAEDSHQQSIPYIRVEMGDSIVEYFDIESELDRSSLEDAELVEMDCITCHNRITHLVLPPDVTVDQLLARGLISTSIPEIRRKAVEVYSNLFSSTELGLNGIAGLKGYYSAVYPDYYTENEGLIDDAILALQDAYEKSVFPEKKSNWTTHPNNIGHGETPGCFRCHDGKHLNNMGEAIRLECNLCHSIPVVAGPNDFVAKIEISRGPEPETHLNPNWITLHREIFDPTCVNCHTTEDPGGTSNTSFCSNSACHGTVFEFAGFDAPGLREILSSQFPPQPEVPDVTEGPMSFEASIGPLLALRCGECHGASGIQGLDLSTFGGTLAGGFSGPAVIPGDPDASLLVQRQSGEQAHFGQFSQQELDLIIEWIEAGAPEK